MRWSDTEKTVSPTAGRPGASTEDGTSFEAGRRLVAIPLADHTYPARVRGFSDAIRSRSAATQPQVAMIDNDKIVEDLHALSAEAGRVSAPRG